MSDSVFGVDTIINGPPRFDIYSGDAHRVAPPPPPSDSTWPWPIAPDTVMPPRRQPVRWGSRADDPPTEIHDDPQRTKAYLAGLAAGRAESRDRTEALRQIVDLPVVDDSDADRMREIAAAGLAARDTNEPKEKP